MYHRCIFSCVLATFPKQSRLIPKPERHDVKVEYIVLILIRDPVITRGQRHGKVEGCVDVKTLKIISAGI